MCLLLTVRAPAEAREALAAAIAGLPAGGLRVELAAPPWYAGLLAWRRAQPRRAEASISESGGCACSLLADDADWDAATWAMRPDVREPLAQTLATLLAGLPGGATVEAFWVGERAAGERPVSPAELAAIARAGALGTHTRYVVAHAPAI
jgi:hypothetical protein